MARGRRENLIPQASRTPEEAREMGTAGGIASGKARREKADMRKIAQALLDSDIVAKDGRRMKGSDAVLHAFQTVTVNPNGRNWAQAMKLLADLTGASKTPTEEKIAQEQLRRIQIENERLRAEIELLKARTEQTRATTETATTEDDGFLDALDGKAAEAWNDANET